jgi:methionine sulfoxide reductase heme-binding subunit
MVSAMAWAGLAFLILTLLPVNLLRLLQRPDGYPLLLWLARRGRPLGLMAGLWFFGHYKMAVKYLRTREGPPAVIQAKYDAVLDNGQIATFCFLILFITSYGWAQRWLRSDWKRLHGLTWFVVPLILIHSISAKWAFEQRLTHVSLVLIASIIAFAGFEARRLFARGHRDRWRHPLLLAAGLLTAIYYRFLFR